MEDSDIAGHVILSIAQLVGAVAAWLDADSNEDQAPEQRFVRPESGFMDFLALQSNLPHEGDILYLDHMRLPKVAIDLLVDICKLYVPNRMETRTVILVALQYLATGVACRVQEQLFQREGFGQQSKYRLIGMRAILKALTDHGFYASDPHEDDHMQASSEAFSREHPLLNLCLGALDGTQIPVRVPDSLKDRSSGFESTVPSGYFYLADSGLGLSLATLTPFRRTRYHLREWATTPQGRPQTSKELFNYRHSKARIVVERAFGLLKMKWKALSSSSYDLKTTILIIHVCAALHNFAIAFSPN
ncbi:hypothetical protein LEN26_001693 [Aphanomyces euteiches]|nr:hypothetical protein LEN26_001693 [Aphanomyces euteiches]